MRKDEMLVPRLDFLIPIQWMSDTFTSGLWDRDEQKMIIGRVAELNPQWVEEVVNNLDHKLTDVLHDFKGIYAEDEHFLPRIQAEDIIGDFDENGDAVDLKLKSIMMEKFDVKYPSDEWVDAQNDACLDENGDEIGKSIMDEFTKLN